MKPDHQVNAIVEGILSYLQEKKVLDLLPEVADQLIKQSWVRFDPHLATITSRVKLDKSQLSEVKKILSTKYNQPIRIKNLVDKSIVAGFKISIAGEVIDGTVDKRLNDLKQVITYD
jgi:F-type H+-transporting ATPase subunit delta